MSKTVKRLLFPEEILSSYDNISKTIDHSLLQPNLSKKEIVAGCKLAVKYNTAAVLVHPYDVKMANKIVQGSTVKVGSGVGFPHGRNLTKTKVFETLLSIENGAEELDMVINIGLIKSQMFKEAEKDIMAVVDAAEGRIVKVILENSYLDYSEKLNACKIVESAGAHFVKTSSGYAPGGATLDDAKLMRTTVSELMQVKAAGGIRTLDAMEEYIKVGVTRFGATATKIILDEYRLRNGYTAL
jgi:deoxyribose-phosphate aldolase